MGGTVARADEPLAFERRVWRELAEEARRCSSYADRTGRPTAVRTCPRGTALLVEMAVLRRRCRQWPSPASGW